MFFRIRLVDFSFTRHASVSRPYLIQGLMEYIIILHDYNVCGHQLRRSRSQQFT